MPFEIHPIVYWSVGIGSVVIFFGSLLLMPAIVIRIPVDYFDHEKRPASRLAHRHPALRLSVKIAKNVLGVTLMLAGLAMLALPGQGLLTVLVGFMLTDIPGKYQAEKWMLRRGLKRPINWLRRRHGKEPLKIDGS
jgi:predicted RND superfamily exporter protein